MYISQKWVTEDRQWEFSRNYVSGNIYNNQWNQWFEQCILAVFNLKSKVAIDKNKHVTALNIIFLRANLKIFFHFFFCCQSSYCFLNNFFFISLFLFKFSSIYYFYLRDTKQKKIQCNWQWMAEQSSNLPDRLIYSWQRSSALASECSIDFSHWSKRRPMSVTASGSSLGLARGTDYWMWAASWKAHDSSGDVAHRWFIRNTLLKFLLINLQRRKRSESESVRGLSNYSECCVCFKSREFC